MCCRAGISEAVYFNWKKRFDGLLETTMILADDASRYRAGGQALCRVDAERFVHRRVPGKKLRRKAIGIARLSIRRFLAGLTGYRRGLTCGGRRQRAHATTVSSVVEPASCSSTGFSPGSIFVTDSRSCRKAF